MHSHGLGLAHAGVLVLTLPATAHWKPSWNAPWPSVSRRRWVGSCRVVAFIRTSPERDTAYTDTLGDVSMGTLGAIVAALVIGSCGGEAC